MPSWDFITEMVLPVLLYMVLPAFASGALVMFLISWLGGAKQAAAGAAVGVCVGAIVGLWCRDAAQVLKATADAWAAAASLANVLSLVPGNSDWNRLPWAILAAVCVGRLAAQLSDGWLLRGGTSIAISWLLLGETTRSEHFWIAPALAAVIAAHWIILDRLATQSSNGSIALAIILTTLVAAQLMLHAHSARFMDALAVLAFAFAGVWLVAWRRGVEFSGAVPAVAVAVPSFLLMGQQLLETKLHWTTFALPALMPFVLAITLPFAHWPTMRLHVVRLILVLILLGATVALAQLAEPLDFSEEPADW
jgi:hypothetical protein